MKRQLIVAAGLLGMAVAAAPGPASAQREVSGAAAAMEDYRPRVRDAGIVIGTLPTGPRNAIVDVEGVAVGHVTLDDADGTIRRSWSEEMGFETADPGQDPRGAPDPMVMWTIFDMTPEGRDPKWYPKLEYK